MSIWSGTVTPISYRWMGTPERLSLEQVHWNNYRWTGTPERLSQSAFCFIRSLTSVLIIPHICDYVKRFYKINHINVTKYLKMFLCILYIK